MTFVLRFFLFAAGLLFAASLAAAGVLMLAVWAARAGWARLTGKPVIPFVFRIDPRSGFGHIHQARQQQGRTPRADAIRSVRKRADVTDVEPRAPM